MKLRYKFIYTVVLLTILNFSCKKFVDVPGPVTSINEANVYTNDATAASVLTGIYTKISQNIFSSSPNLNSLTLFAGLAADELTLYNGVTDKLYLQHYMNALTATSSSPFWYNIYPIIFSANSAIEGLTNSQSLTPALKQQLIGEAKFVRAFCYSYLVNLYGDVPLVINTDYVLNASLPRSAKSDVWKQVITDLLDAQNELSSDFLDGTVVNTTVGRLRPTKWAAGALLARAYLYTEDWVDAEAEASTVISNNGTFKLLNDLNSIFLSNSVEAIWQLQPVNIGQNTQDGLMFVLPSTGPTTTTTHPVYLSATLLNSFEPGDQRKRNWTDSVVVGSNTYYYPNKYKVGLLNKPVTEYLMVLRLAEQYLIRAQARAQQNKISEAQSDLNMIRARAGLSNTTAATQSDLVTAILHERQIELFTEWGHRWFDLIRTNNIDNVMNIVTAKKGSTWSSYKALFPIPDAEITHDPQLTQNEGY